MPPGEKAVTACVFVFSERGGVPRLFMHAVLHLRLASESRAHVQSLRYLSLNTHTFISPKGRNGVNPLCAGH